MVKNTKLDNDNIIELYQMVIKEFDNNAIRVLNNNINKQKLINDFIKLIHQNIK